MNEELIEQIVQSVLARLSAQEMPVAAPSEVPAGESIPDITAVDLRGQYLVDSPKDRDAYLALKENTPARVGIGHAGARYRTATVLRFQADHAAAQDAVFSDVSQNFLDGMGLIAYSTACQDVYSSICVSY